MASFKFVRQPSSNVTNRFGIEFSRLGQHVPRKPQLTAEDMTTVVPGIPRNWPHGVDRKAPLLPGGR